VQHMLWNFTTTKRFQKMYLKRFRKNVTANLSSLQNVSPLGDTINLYSLLSDIF
jgi:uncharacterized protein YnzC (UPF0291/DUF896 family)